MPIQSNPLSPSASPSASRPARAPSAPRPAPRPGAFAISCVISAGGGTDCRLQLSKISPRLRALARGEAGLRVRATAGPGSRWRRTSPLGRSGKGRRKGRRDGTRDAGRRPPADARGRGTQDGRTPRTRAGGAGREDVGWGIPKMLDLQSRINRDFCPFVPVLACTMNPFQVFRVVACG